MTLLRRADRHSLAGAAEGTWDDKSAKEFLAVGGSYFSRHVLGRATFA
jgi:hypothetical protein